jgi:cytidylate kinase
LINVAIDGPSGAGKSSISKTVAKELGYIYIDTGAMYRTLAYKALKLGIDINSDTDAVEHMLSDTTVDIRHCDDGQHMFADGEDVTAYIRTPEVSMGASDIAKIPSVRKWLLDLQRSFARSNNCIMDGRDIGTVVLPDAKVKIFLTASPEARAERRLAELREKGSDISFEQVLEDMKKRDENDASRSCAPLKQADDAVLVDTSELDFEQSVAAVKDVIRQKTEE